MKSTHAIGWAQLKKRAPILDRAFHWNSAASHSDPSQFRARQEARRIAAQSKPAVLVKRIRDAEAA